MVDVHDGALPQLFAATGPKDIVGSGHFYFSGVTEFTGHAIVGNTMSCGSGLRWN